MLLIWLLRGPCARGTKIKARIQRDEQLINREKFQADKGFTFEVKGKRLGGKVLELHNITKNFPKGNGNFTSDKENSSPAKQNFSLAKENSSATNENFTPVIKNFSYKFTKGQKIGIFGDNGSGKSTFLNIITQKIAPDSGTLDIGVNTKFGYYTQNPVFADTSLTVLEYIKETAEHMTVNNGTKEVSATKFLEEFGFEGKIQYSSVSTLSGGERKRLFLVRLLLENPNFLILDEPTNDFDIFTMNILEPFLLHYKGCLLLVSHDRYFMDKTVDSLFILEDDGNISGFVGKCSEYIEYREELLKELKENKNSKDDVKIPLDTTGIVTSHTALQQEKPKKLSFKEQREFEQLDKEIPQLEAEQKNLEADMSSTDFSIVQKASERYNEIVKLLEEKYPRWEELAERA